MKSNNWETDIYAKNLQTNSWPYTEVISEVKRYYPGTDLVNKTVAEIGCGTGNNLLFFCKENCVVSGLDFSQSAIYKAEKLLERHALSANLFCGDVTDPLPWEENSIDIFLDRGCLTQVNFQDVPLILREVRRVLKIGGIFFGFTLFGDDSSDLKFGVEEDKNTYDNFKNGYFSKVGKTSVYNESTIRELLTEFKILKLIKTQKNDLFNNTCLNTYSFVVSRTS